MSFISADLNQRSVIALVGSDLSYAREGALIEGLSPLSTLQDSDPEANLFPVSLAIQAGIPIREVEVLQKTEVALGDWILKRTLNDATTGFGALVLYSQDRNEYLVALTGTNGLDGQDWFNNLNVSTTQWTASNRSNFRQTIDQLRTDNPNFLTAHITFAGQSLGGALAQFAAYEFTEHLPQFSRSQMSVITFNGLGSFAGMPLMYVDFDPNRLADAETAHYVITNDIVHRFGNGNFNAAGNTFLLDFRELPGQERTRNPVDAHRIEAGFYRGFGWADISLVARDLGWGSFETAAFPHAINYINLRESQRLAAAFAQLFNDSDYSPVESWARLIAGVTHGLRSAPLAELQQATAEFLEHLRRASPSADSTVLWSTLRTVVPIALKAAASSQPGVTLSVFSLLAGISLDIGEDIAGANEGMRDRVAQLLPPEQYDLELAQNVADQPDFAHAIFKALLGFKIADGTILNGVNLQYNAGEILSTAFREPAWLNGSFRALSEQAAHEGSLPSVSMALAGSAILLAKRLGGSLVDEVRADVAEFATDIGRAIANAHQELVTKFVDTVFDLQQVIRFTDSRPLINDLKQGLEESIDPDVGQAFEGALEIIESAAQAVVIRSGDAEDPFDDPLFDPDAPAIANGELREGAAKTFVAYLPYEAGSGGQQIKIKLAGASVEKLTVFGGDETKLSADGTFTLTISEGQRQISFAIAALEDIDAGQTFTLSTQLIAVVDGQELATHLGHEEATLLLDANDETPPAGGMEFHGEWGPKLYPTLDRDGHPIPGEFHTQFDTRYPHTFNIERDAGAPLATNSVDGVIVGGPWADHIWTGYQWQTIGAGGDDYIEGWANVPNFIADDGGSYGEGGNNVFEGGENATVHEPDGQTFNGEKIETSGDDIIFGGSGDDELYADRIALLDQVFDPETPTLDMLGDWIAAGRGNDRVFGSAAHDALFGGGGADTIHGGAGNDVLDGDDDYHPNGFIFWEFNSSDFVVEFFPVTNLSIGPGFFDYYQDVGGDDVLDGGTGDDLIFGMLGNDTLIGGAGADRLEGWQGDDQLFGGDDNDVLAGDFGRYEDPLSRLPQMAYHAVAGAAGLFTTTVVEVNQIGNDFLDGGAGDDQMYGDGGDDTLFGRDGADLMYGDGSYVPEEWQGGDFLDGGAGADTMFGNAGDDELFGGADDDWISGDAGDDFADGGIGDDFVLGGDGNDVLEGRDGNDVVIGDAGADALDGGAGADQLIGGADDDVLRGGADADTLDGGEGSDSLVGGFGDDVLLGGEGDDRLDGGGGLDVLLGGGGNDTYVFGLGYGREVIQDSEGVTRLAFGAGVEADDLSISLDAETLSATIAFGGVGDSITVSLAAANVGGVDFANGTAWGKKEFITVVPALVSIGSDESDVLVGNENLRNELRGFGGDDFLLGSANDDLLAGGEGADGLDGGAGSDVYVYGPEDVGIDQLADSEIQAQAYLQWYYDNLGISDWIERGQHGGEYRASYSIEGDTFSGYYDSAEEAAAALPFAEIRFVEPLPAIAPLLRRDDDAALQELVQAGVLSRDVVQFEEGLGLSDLTLTVSVDSFAAGAHPDQPWHDGATLSVRWANGDGGFDLAVPGVDYGFNGTNLLSDGFQTTDGSWRGYRLGEGVENFRFADGTSYSLEEILGLADVVETAPEYAFSRFSGMEVIDRSYGIVRFADDIRWEEVVVSRDGVDLLLTLADGSAQGRVEGWYADPAAMPQLTLAFGSDPEVSAETLTELGLQVNGTEGDDVLTGADNFGDVLYGGTGNDVLNGGTGKDTYLFRRGDGTDQIVEVPVGAGDPEASVIVLEDFFSWEAHFGLGSLLLDLGNGDAIHFTGFDSVDPYSTPVFDRIEFADGQSLSFADVMAMGFQFFGSDDDEVFTGTGVNDFIDGAGGDDIFYGLGGDDALQGGEGSDTYVYAAGDGDDNIVDWDETPGETDTLRLQGIAPDQVRITRDGYSYYVVFESGERVMLDSAARETVAEIERVEFDDGTVWSPADLATRVELLPGTERDDPLWGTAQDDVIYGLGGGDALFGNGGDDFLAGGEGSDVYLFAPGDGTDVIDNYDEDGSPDDIFFSEASSTDTTLTRRGDDLLMTVANGGNRISLTDWYVGPNRKIDFVFFGGDSVSWDAAMLEELAPESGDAGANAAPEVANPLTDQTALEDEAFSFPIPEGTFSDADSDTLTYSATLADGSALPEWLSFDPELRLLSGAPRNSDVGTLELAVTATDSSDESATDIFVVEVLNTNDAPMVVGTIADAAAREGQAFSLNIPESIFADPDLGDSFTLSAIAPTWLSFHEGIFSGTPGSSDAGQYTIEVRATDSEGASAATSFRLTVADVPADGNRLVGTPNDDVLIGTNADEVLLGRRGDDLLIGGGGDDVLRGGRGDDDLYGGAGDDVLRGGRGDDVLHGGTGNDVYVHGLHGGDDAIVEAGGADILRFAEGISRAMVSARRVRDDLVLDISGAHGSVTVKDWFGSQERRVERIEFAGGATWDEDKIRSLVRKSDSAAVQHVDLTRERSEKGSAGNAQAGTSAGDDRSRDETVAAIWRRLSSEPNFDFEEFLRAPASKQQAPSFQEIERQWALAHRYSSALAFESDPMSMASWLPAPAKLSGPSATGFGFEGSVGALRAEEGLKALEGLSEGFRRL